MGSSTWYSILCLLSISFQSLALRADQLQLRINAAVHASTGRGLVGSIATIRGLDEWSDEQIADLAFTAHAAMIDEYTKSFPSFAGLGKKAPGVTTTLIVDNTAYISSSANSAGTFLYLPNGNREGSRFTQLNPAHPCKGSVEQALTRCQLRAVNFDTGHRTGASCGEPMAALAFCATNNQRSLDNAKIVSITGKDKYKIVPPCGHPDGHLTYDGEWGCHSFLEELAMGMHVLSADTGRTATDVSDDDIAISYATYP